MFSYLSCKCLARRPKRLPGSSSSSDPRVRPFDKLPVENLHEISRHLDNFEVVLLSLTCRTLRYTLVSSTLVLDSEDTRSLLSLLRKDIPRYFVCHFCVQMHRFWSAVGPLNCRAYGELPPGSRCRRKFDTMYPTGSIPMYRLAFHHVQLVMDGYFLGQSHGLPLDILAGEVRSRPLPDFATSQTWQSRIIASELFLSVTYRFTHSGPLYRVLRDLDQLAVAICPHLWTFGGRIIPDLQFRAWSYACAHSPEEYRASGSCTGCLTDYKVFLSLLNHRYRLTIVTYHQLGYCRSPYDWKWQAYRPALGPFSASAIPSRAAKGYGTGEVQRAWDHDTARREDDVRVIISHIRFSDNPF
jgi:hypothetical protein